MAQLIVCLVVNGTLWVACLDFLSKDVSHESDLEVAVNGAQNLLVLDIIWLVQEVEALVEVKLFQA